MPLPPVSDLTTRVGLDPVSSLCSTGKFAGILTGALVRLLQEHFSNPSALIYDGENEQNPNGSAALQLQNYQWTSDPRTTAIQIQPVWLYNAEDIQRRPAIYVKRNKWQSQRLAIADGFTVGPTFQQGANNEKIVERVPGQYQTRMIAGSHSVFCLSQKGAEAELLGSEVFEWLTSFCQPLREELKLTRLEVLDLGEIALLDEHVEAYGVPIVLAYQFSYTWRVGTIGPWLKTVAIDVGS